MGREIVYCSQCGVRILEKDLAAGRAFTVLDKVFCAECRDQAFTQDPAPRTAAPPALKGSAAHPSGPALKGSVAHPSGPARPSAPPLGPIKAAVTAARPPMAGLRPSAPPRRPEGVAAPRVTVKRSNPMPMYIGSAVGVVGIVVLIVIIMSSGSDKTKKGAGSPGAVDGGAKEAEKKLTPEERAALKLNELHQFASTATDPAAVVKKAVDAEKEIVNTPSEEAYRTFRKRWERKVGEVDAGKKIDALLGQAKSIVAADPEFKRYAEVRELLQKADEAGLEAGAEKVADVQNYRKSVEEPYEAAADDWFDKNGDRIRTWMRESDFKAALMIIDKFPEPLKLSKVWRINLAKLREDALKGKAAAEAKAAGKEVAKEWNYYHNIGNQELGLKNYARAKENLLKAESLLPAPDKLTDRQKEAVAWNILYNIGCIYALESKDLKGDEQKKAVDAAFDYLRKSAEAGVFGFRCGHRDHPTAKDHWDKDEDLAPIRADARYAEIIQKHDKK